MILFDKATRILMSAGAIISLVASVLTAIAAAEITVNALLFLCLCFLVLIIANQLKIRDKLNTIHNHVYDLNKEQQQ